MGVQGDLVKMKENLITASTTVIRKLETLIEVCSKLKFMKARILKFSQSK